MAERTSLSVAEVREQIRAERAEADAHGEGDRAARRNFTRPRFDPRVRTAPHGDALSTVTGYLQENDDPGHRFYEFYDAFTHVLARVGPGGPPFKLHPYQLDFLERMERGERVILNRGRSSGWRSLLAGTAAAGRGRLTPGALKLAGARIMARGRPGDDSVAQAMADQIDFEWEERRWWVPDGDAVAAENGMGC